MVAQATEIEVLENHHIARDRIIMTSRNRLFLCWYDVRAAAAGLELLDCRAQALLCPNTFRNAGDAHHRPLGLDALGRAEPDVVGSHAAFFDPAATYVDTNRS